MTDQTPDPTPATPVRRAGVGGRPFNATSPLGQWMVRERLSVRDLAAAVNINDRKLSDYLARRSKIIDAHAVRLSLVTGLSAEALNAYQLASVDPRGEATGKIATPATPDRSALVAAFRNRQANATPDADEGREETRPTGPRSNRVSSARGLTAAM